MDAIFQQAPFDEKNDIRRIEEIAKEVEYRAKRTPGYHYGKCSKCGRIENGFARVLDGSFICVGCLVKDEVERKFNEAK